MIEKFKNKIGIETPILFGLIVLSVMLRYITLDVPEGVIVCIIGFIRHGLLMAKILELGIPLG